ncbi:MAG: C10 family peptidase, partial [Bacteroidales bacterium]
YSVADVVTRQKEGISTFYIFIFNAGGYVMVAADDAVIPVLGYSEDGTYIDTDIPQNIKLWLDDYSEQIKYIIDSQLDNTQTLQEWNKIRNDQMPSAKSIVGPYCNTTWDQSPYYNNLCPGGSVTGCVATAMAQIMKKWNYPTTGVGSHTYTDATYGALTVNFGSQTYNWAQMPTYLQASSTATQKTAVATLMYHCGVSVNMQYSTSGSGAYTQDVPDALINYFAYQNTAELQYKAAFTNTNWINMLERELDAARPVLYSGDDGTAGHAFVCDGYNTSTNQFHFNWGWSGMDNGYFTIGSLNTSQGNFNNNNSAVVRITPPLNGPIADFTASTTTPAVGGTVTFTDYSTNNPTNWTWTFDGGTPSTYSGQTPPAITYSTAGTYQVSLTVTNGNGTDTKIRSMYINVGGTPSAWIKQNSGFAKHSRGISQISIVDPNIVWAAAYNGVSSTNPIQEFTKTVNGGTTWTPGTITFTGSENYGIANLHAFSNLICYACMFPSAANGGYIVKTTDGGITWTIQSSANFSTSWANFVHFFDANNGVCVGDPTTTPFEFMIYTTSNGGSTWTQVNVNNIPGPSNGETAIVNQFDAFGNTIWFGTSMGKVFKSTDKGLTWTVTVTGLGTSAVVTPVFKDASTGIATGTNNSTGAYIGMKKTTNGGSSWTTLTPTGIYLKNPNLDFVPGTTSMWVDGSSYPGTGSSYSNNDCTSFVDIDTASTIQYTCVKFYDINTGWAGSFNAGVADGGIYKWDPSIIVGVNEQPETSQEQISIYPNPTNDFINIKFFGITSVKANISVYNLMGKKVIDREFNPLLNDNLKLDISDNVAGIYLITVNTGKSLITKRISLIR